MAAMIVLVPGAGLLAVRSIGSHPAASTPPVAAPAPQAKLTPLPTPRPGTLAAATPEQRTRIDVPNNWTEVPLPPDAARPTVSLVASEPIRVRSKGQLYLVAGNTPVAVDLKDVSSIDVRAVSTPASLTVVRSANGGSR
ncbi:hypothetical protein MKI84_03000 [Ancylobacter sp. A5.8]|uniref:hypothetical protein n=1 Tax=Ancylobacter gelatini TaxID=2919920 RepID=UPI001F4DECD7|nr:hypothetical protein [Ancylobacter gelatini]MCJ8141873.1 hypothetical protein [Ancylobacter gelatini]